MTTEVSTTETLDHLDVVWHDDIETLEKVFRAALGREVILTRIGGLISRPLRRSAMTRRRGPREACDETPRADGSTCAV
jgi:hypothetical protein